MALEKKTRSKFLCTGYYVVRFGIHSNSSNQVFKLGLDEIRHLNGIDILNLALSISALKLSHFLSLQKLASKVARTRACCCGTQGGVHGGMRA